MRSSHPLDLSAAPPPTRPTPPGRTRAWPWLALAGALAVPAVALSGLVAAGLMLAAFTIVVWVLSRAVPPGGGGLGDWRQ